MVTFIYYPKCSTCKKAKTWLEEHKIAYQERHIVIEHPTKEELSVWVHKYDVPLKKYFNTSGLVYKKLNLKERLPKMSLEEQLELLATDGMLVHRPLLLTERGILIGFVESEWESLLQK